MFSSTKVCGPSFGRGLMKSVVGNVEFPNPLLAKPWWKGRWIGNWKRRISEPLFLQSHDGRGNEQVTRNVERDEWVIWNVTFAGVLSVKPWWKGYYVSVCKCSVLNPPSVKLWWRGYEPVIGNVALEHFPPSKRCWEWWLDTKCSKILPLRCSYR